MLLLLDDLQGSMLFRLFIDTRWSKDQCYFILFTLSQFTLLANGLYGWVVLGHTSPSLLKMNYVMKKIKNMNIVYNLLCDNLFCIVFLIWFVYSQTCCLLNNWFNSLFDFFNLFFVLFVSFVICFIYFFFVSFLFFQWHYYIRLFFILIVSSFVSISWLSSLF